MAYQGFPLSASLHDMRDHVCKHSLYRYGSIILRELQTFISGTKRKAGRPDSQGTKRPRPSGHAHRPNTGTKRNPPSSSKKAPASAAYRAGYYEDRKTRRADIVAAEQVSTLQAFNNLKFTVYPRGV